MLLTSFAPVGSSKRILCGSLVPGLDDKPYPMLGACTLLLPAHLVLAFRWYHHTIRCACFSSKMHEIIKLCAEDGHKNRQKRSRNRGVLYALTELNSTRKQINAFLSFTQVRRSDDEKSSWNEIFAREVCTWYVRRSDGCYFLVHFVPPRTGTYRHSASDVRMIWGSWFHSLSV